MTGRQHIIKSVLFDTSVATEEQAERWRSTLGRLRIEAVFEKALRAFDARPGWIRIDRLEIDLGEMGWEDENEWSARIAEALEEQLADRVHAYPLHENVLVWKKSAIGNERYPAQQLPEDEFRLEAIVHYLRTGVYPWQLDWRDDLALVLSELMDQNPVLVESRLRNVLREQRECQDRILAILSIAQTIELVQLFSGKKIIEELLALFAMLESRQPLLSRKENRHRMLGLLLNASVKAGKNNDSLLATIAQSQDVPALLFEILDGGEILSPSTTREVQELLNKIVSQLEPIPRSIIHADTGITSALDGGSRPDDLLTPDPAEQDLGEDEIADELFIPNAGLVLLNPALLMHFFERMRWTRDRAFRSEHARSKTMLWLHYLVTGNQDIREYHLALNKLLCGMWPTDIADITVRLSGAERKAGRELLETVSENWTALKGTSMAGLRDSFLQRPGRLKNEEGGWQLHVESKAYDILIEQLPWTFSIIKFPWMIKPLYTQWSTRI